MANVKRSVKTTKAEEKAVVKPALTTREEVKTEEKKETVKPAEVKVEAEKATKAVAEAAPAKKAAEKKPVAKKAPAKKAEVKVNIAVQFDGKSYTSEELMSIAKDVWKYDLKKKATELVSVDLYVKPEEALVYYVFNKDVAGSFSI